MFFEDVITLFRTPKTVISDTPKRVENKRPQKDQLRRRKAKAFARDIMIPLRNPGPPAHVRQDDQNRHGPTSTATGSLRVDIHELVVKLGKTMRQTLLHNTEILGIVPLPSRIGVNGAPPHVSTAGATVIRRKNPLLQPAGPWTYPIKKKRRTVAPVASTNYAGAVPPVPGAERKRILPARSPTAAIKHRARPPNVIIICIYERN